MSILSLFPVNTCNYSVIKTISSFPSCYEFKTFPAPKNPTSINFPTKKKGPINSFRLEFLHLYEQKRNFFYYVLQLFLTENTIPE